MNIDAPCWSTIGISGDRTCAELERHIHCRNCPVLGHAADRMRRRDPPDGYLEDMAAVIARPAVPPEPQRSALVFHLGHDDWFAVDTSCVVEVASTRPVHRVAHRGGVVAGLVNVRGHLLLAVQLGHLLGITHEPSKRSGRAEGRIVVIERNAETWAFAADAVEGTLQFSASDRMPPPATLTPALASVTLGTLPWGNRRIILIDSVSLFDLLKRQVAE